MTATTETRRLADISRLTARQIAEVAVSAYGPLAAWYLRRRVERDGTSLDGRKYAAALAIVEGR